MNNKIMQSSFSQDILQRLRAMSSHNSQQIKYGHSYGNVHGHDAQWNQDVFKINDRKQIISYNQCITDHSPKRKGRYRLRNCRQPNLKIIETDIAKKSHIKERATSYLGLKELMKEEIEKNSVKRKYEDYMENFSDQEVVQKLRYELFFPASPKIAHKNRYRPNKKMNLKNGSYHIMIDGSKVKEKSASFSQVYDQQRRSPEMPQSPKKTAGYELKYRKNYLGRKEEAPKNASRPFQRNEEEQTPLTGWN